MKDKQHKPNDTNGNVHSTISAENLLLSGKKDLYHVDIHTGKETNPYVCSECNKYFPNYKDLHRHELKFHTNHFCHDCGICFKGRSELRQHKKFSCTQKPTSFKCSICDQSFEDGKILEEHQRSHQINPLECRLCFKLFKSEMDAKEHKKETCSRRRRRIRRRKFINEIKKDVKLSAPINKVSLTCKLCKKCFESKKALYEHKKMHIDSSFTCQNCSKRFLTLQGIIRHHRECAKQQKKRSLPMTFECQDCGESFPNKLKLKIHRYKHTGVYSHKCSHCQMSFSAAFALRKHQREEHGILKPEDQEKERLVKKFVCEICGKICRKINTLTRHMRIHTQEKPFGCDVCGRAFPSDKSLLEHKRIHSGEKPYPCDSCPKAFRTMQRLQFHIMCHTGEKPFACSFCDKRFRLKILLTNHLAKVHNQGKANKQSNSAQAKQKKYTCMQYTCACRYCDKVFRSYNGRDLHEKCIHLGIKHTCDQCGRVFNFKANFQRHMNSVHCIEKPFPCGLCDKVFALKSTLKAHQVVHTGEKAYKCDVCPAAYTESRGLRKHKAREHQGHFDTDQSLQTEQRQESHTEMQLMSFIPPTDQSLMKHREQEHQGHFDTDPHLQTEQRQEF